MLHTHTQRVLSSHSQSPDNEEHRPTHVYELRSLRGVHTVSVYVPQVVVSTHSLTLARQRETPIARVYGVRFRRYGVTKFHSERCDACIHSQSPDNDPHAHTLCTHSTASTQCPFHRHWCATASSIQPLTLARQRETAVHKCLRPVPTAWRLKRHPFSLTLLMFIAAMYL